MYSTVSFSGKRELGKENYDTPEMVSGARMGCELEFPQAHGPYGKRWKDFFQMRFEDNAGNAASPIASN
jgi:hypothetical protein